MIKELTDLTVKTDGRYASDQDLQFLTKYLEEAESRKKAYIKVRDQAAQIIDKLEEEKKKLNPNFEGWYSTCKRDFIDLLRYSAAAMLFDDLERLRNGMLVWFKTIVRAYNFDQDSDETYALLIGVMKFYLSEDELKYIIPALQLNQAVLA